MERKGGEMERKKISLCPHFPPLSPFHISISIASFSLHFLNLSLFPHSLTIFSQRCGQAAAVCDNLLVTNLKEIICLLSDFWLSNKEVGAPPPFLFSGKTFKQWSPWFVIGNINRKVLLLLKTYCILYLTFCQLLTKAEVENLCQHFCQIMKAFFAELVWNVGISFLFISQIIAFCLFYNSFMSTGLPNSFPKAIMKIKFFDFSESILSQNTKKSMFWLLEGASIF